MTAYIPDRGDVVWLDFDPQLGHEQAGKRPAVVFSPLDYNKRIGLGLFFAITSQIKGYPFEVRIQLSKIDGVVLAAFSGVICRGSGPILPAVVLVA